MLERIAASISRYGMFSPGQRVGVAVSGGADSVCLLEVLIELGPRWDLHLSVLHVDHRLRGEESRADAEFVRALAAERNLPFRCHEADVRGISAATGDNLEQAARRVRREFFLGFIRGGALDRVALGHTRSDQAETVLFRILRGCGTAGLAGVRAVTSDGLVRPLIDVSRCEVVDWLRSRGISWREDSTNADRSFARNRIRHDLLPQLVREWNPEMEATLAGMADVAGEEEAYWARLAGQLAGANFIRKGAAVLLEAGWLASLPRAVARRVVRAAMEEVKGDLRGIDLGHVDAVLALSARTEGSGRFQAPGVDVFRSFDWLRVAPRGHYRLEADSGDYEIAAGAPGRYSIPGTDWVVSLEVIDAKGANRETETPSPGYNERVNALELGRVAGGVRLRNWRPGDRYRPIGHASEVSIKSLFQHARVPLWDRRKWPVMTCGESIVWVARFGPAAEFAATPRSGAAWMVHENFGKG